VGAASGLEDLFGRTEEGAEGAPYPADKQNDDQDEGGSDSGGSVRMAGGEPGERYGSHVFAEGEADVGEGFGRWRDGGTDGGLASVGCEGDGCTEKGGNELFLRRQRGGGTPRDESGDRYADEGMERVPDEIEGRDFVGEEFDCEECGAGSDYPPAGEEMKLVRQDEDATMSQQAEGGQSRVHIEAGSEGNGDDERDEFLAGDGELHGDSIGGGGGAGSRQ